MLKDGYHTACLKIKSVCEKYMIFPLSIGKKIAACDFLVTFDLITHLKMFQSSTENTKLYLYKVYALVCVT